jgi:diaminopropionate ammonia-lyase
VAAPRFRFLDNRFRKEPVSSELLPPRSKDARAFHRTLPGYAPTLLVALPELAQKLGAKNLWVKDESKRFGLNAFKALGASYAIHRFLKGRNAEGITFTTATDGNHGRAVAWTAARLHQRAVIYVPGNTSRARIDALKEEGAEVVVVDGNYDETVVRAAKDAEKFGRQVISDTAWPGYTEIPRWIMEGYETLFDEIDEQIPKAPTLVMLQAGVGGLAYAGACHYRRGKGPRLICVEPTDADCLLESIASPDGSIQVAKGKQNSIMAGLNCGTPSLVAWPLLREALDGFVAVDDAYAEDAMRQLAPKVVSGESGAAGLAGLLALPKEAQGQDVLLISTEGDTDPESYRRILGP